MKIITGNRRKILFGIIIISAVLLTSLVTHNQMQDIPDPDPQLELESFHIADGFEVTLFAADPLVVKPIQMNWDADGRLWVVTSTAYPHMKTGEEANDKIYVLEDLDGDGKADKSTIFAEGLQTPTGILPGDGGVYVANSTEILHFEDKDGDGKADTRRRVLNGFGTADTHHLIHTFRWGPDGLLYFNQSIYIYSHVETPSGVKRLEGGGVWQLDPQTLKLDVYAKGLINPWGLQFNRWGQSFLTDGAGGEGINYAFPGATFLASLGAERIIQGLNPGQPKHSGLEVISGRHLPESWQGSVITNDFRANRINRFKLEEQGSGYVSKQQEDLLWTDHVAFRPVDISVGPDGAIYVADWYNPIIQHGEVDFHDPRRDQQHGRIWRIVAKNRPLVANPQLKKAGIPELLEALKQPEDWTRSQAKQVLKKNDADLVIAELQKWTSNLDKTDPNYEHHLLEALWVHQNFDVVNEQLLMTLLNAKNHHARAAALRVLQFWHDKIANVPTLLSKAVADKHAVARLEAVIALRKLNTAEAARMALTALEQPMDGFLDYALWQTVRMLEPLWIERIKDDPAFLGNSKSTVFALKSVNNPDAVTRLTRLYRQGQVPEEYEKDVLSAIAKWGSASDLSILLDMAVKAGQNKNIAARLSALEQAAKRQLKPDQDLNSITNLIVNDDESVTISAIRLIGYWRMENMSQQLIDLLPEKSKNIQKAVLEALVSMNNSKSEKLLLSMASGKNGTALRLLATAQLVNVNASEAARSAGELFRNVPADEDFSDVFLAFLSNKEAINALAKELNIKKIPENIAKQGRQVIQRQLPWNRHKDEDVKFLKQALEASGGTLPAEKMKQQLADHEIKNLANEIRATADPALGEIVFRNNGCMPCHAIGGAGGPLGPDLSSLGTSSPIETIIRSILYPTESIKEGFELQSVVKKDGSSLMGYLVSNGSSEIILRDMAGTELSVSKSQIDKVEKIPGSLMPPGLTSGLSREEFINLAGFLSRLGESGKFRVPNARYVRRWEMVSANKELTKNIKEKGIEYIVNEDAKITFQPAYSKVSGDLPIEELPVVEVNPNKRYSFVKFGIEVLSEGNVQLSMNSTNGVNAWVGNRSLRLTDNGAVVNLSRGIHRITLAIDRLAKKDDRLAIQLQDADQAPAQTRLILKM